VSNATGLFALPGSGLRLVNDADQLACFEFAATHGSESMRRLLFGLRPGLTELAAFTLYQPPARWAQRARRAQRSMGSAGWALGGGAWGRWAPGRNG
jgi:hypothetical protein